MRKWIKINGYKINVTKIVAICPLKTIGSESFIEVYFSGGPLLIRMPSEEEAVQAHSHLSLLAR